MDEKRFSAIFWGKAEVAVTVVLTDQAHLNRAFAHRYGVTPARYQRQVRGQSRRPSNLVQDADPSPERHSVS